MGGFTLIFVSLLVYLSMKGRLNTYIDLATTSSTTPKSNNPPAGSQQPNEAGKGDALTPATPATPPSAGTGATRGIGTGSPLDPTPVIDLGQLVDKYASELRTMSMTFMMQNIFTPLTVGVQ